MTNTENFRNCLDSNLHNTQGGHATTLEDWKIFLSLKAVINFIQFYSRFCCCSLIDFNFLGFFGFGVFFFFNSVFTNKNLQNKMKPQLFVYYLEVTVGIPMTTNKI